VTDDLAQFIAGRPAWAMKGKAAVLSADNGWTGRVREQNQYVRVGERYHAVVLDPRGVARHTRPCHTIKEGVEWAERVVRSQ
jgi:hypothetical protein